MKQLLPDEVTDTDLIYLTANRSSLSAQKKERKQDAIYEGLTIYDVQKIDEAASKGVTIVAEYTALANTASKMTREQLYPILGVSSSGWQGKYVSHLQNMEEVPGGFGPIMSSRRRRNGLMPELVFCWFM
ncbi:hypothetical protein P9222_02610 [Paenibacillus amylolyticus]|nr:hypothetical protein [Paenibacillus amylolyticus]WFR63314.1 hypothetical protein P9222_02610 [Paenibacillus amylolyticus]